MVENERHIFCLLYSNYLYAMHSDIQGDMSLFEI